MHHITRRKQRQAQPGFLSGYTLSLGGLFCTPRVEQGANTPSPKVSNNRRWQILPVDRELTELANFFVDRHHCQDSFDPLLDRSLNQIDAQLIWDWRLFGDRIVGFGWRNTWIKHSLSHSLSGRL